MPKIAKERSIIVIFTSHNRVDKTRKSIYSLDDSAYEMRYVAVDDGCTDRTADMLSRFAKEKNRIVDIIEGDGRLYWAGGMRKGMEYVLDKGLTADYVLLINDDVVFSVDSVKIMMEATSRQSDNSCIVGVISDIEGNMIYGGIRYDMKHAKDVKMELTDSSYPCDAANMNCFLMPYHVFVRTGVFDSRYTHSMADFDYCFSLKKAGSDIYMTDSYVGTCKKNDVKGSWRDNTLHRLDRLNLKESPKGLPRREWFYYLHKNFGLRTAVWHSITPYARIALGK